MKAWLVLLPLLFTQSIAGAALKWEQLRADLAPGPKDKSVEARFAFVNEGQTTVTIEAVKSSCGCTTAALDKMVYAPGEKGEVRARFDLGQRSGLQTKTIAVKIQNDPTPTILTLAVAIAEPVKLVPALVVWEKGEANKAKSFKFARGFNRSTHVSDDHVPLQNAGIAAIDIIDFDYEDWHKLSDTPAKCSGDQLAEVGGVILTWLKGK